MVRTGMTGMVGTRIGGMFIQEYALNNSVKNKKSSNLK